MRKGTGSSYTGVSETASTEVTPCEGTEETQFLRACSYRITENSHWFPQTWTPHNSVHFYVPLGVILLCYIFIYLSHSTQPVFCPLLHKFVCDSTHEFWSHAAFRVAQEEAQQSYISAHSIPHTQHSICVSPSRNSITENSLHTN